LSGGHCIGVDPYYLTHKAEEIGYHPQIILAGRRINDGMGAYVAGQLVKAMLKRHIQVNGARVIDVVLELHDYGIQVDVYDPWVDADEAQNEYGIDLISSPVSGGYEGIVLAVAHDEFCSSGQN